VGAGHVVRFRRARPDRIVRSRVPAHPAIVSVQNSLTCSCSAGPAAERPARHSSGRR
jgi:hypothetical protein